MAQAKEARQPNDLTLLEEASEAIKVFRLQGPAHNSILGQVYRIKVLVLMNKVPSDMV
jgi:hypothetical protein